MRVMRSLVPVILMLSLVVAGASHAGRMGGLWKSGGSGVPALSTSSADGNKAGEMGISWDDSLWRQLPENPVLYGACRNLYEYFGVDRTKKRLESVEALAARSGVNVPRVSEMDRYLRESCLIPGGIFDCLDTRVALGVYPRPDRKKPDVVLLFERTQALEKLFVAGLASCSLSSARFTKKEKGDLIEYSVRYLGAERSPEGKFTGKKVWKDGHFFVKLLDGWIGVSSSADLLDRAGSWETLPPSVQAARRNLGKDACLFAALNVDAFPPQVKQRVASALRWACFSIASSVKDKTWNAQIRVELTPQMAQFLERFAVTSYNVEAASVVGDETDALLAVDIGENGLRGVANAMPMLGMVKGVAPAAARMQLGLARLNRKLGGKFSLEDWDWFGGELALCVDWSLQIPQVAVLLKCKEGGRRKLDAFLEKLQSLSDQYGIVIAERKVGAYRSLYTRIPGVSADKVEIGVTPIEGYLVLSSGRNIIQSIVGAKRKLASSRLFLALRRECSGSVPFVMYLSRRLFVRLSELMVSKMEKGELKLPPNANPRLKAALERAAGVWKMGAASSLFAMGVSGRTQLVFIFLSEWSPLHDKLELQKGPRR